VISTNPKEESSKRHFRQTPFSFYQAFYDPFYALFTNSAAAGGLKARLCERSEPRLARSSSGAPRRGPRERSSLDSASASELPATRNALHQRLSARASGRSSASPKEESSIPNVRQSHFTFYQAFYDPFYALFTNIRTYRVNLCRFPLSRPPPAPPLTSISKAKKRRDGHEDADRDVARDVGGARGAPSCARGVHGACAYTMPVFFITSL
jgi:hypothetical protein